MGGVQGHREVPGVVGGALGTRRESLLGQAWGHRAGWDRDMEGLILGEGMGQGSRGGCAPVGQLEAEALSMPLQNNPPYNVGAFRFELAFSPQHPLVPPRVKLLTNIHHPGVGLDGTVCQPLTSPEKWEPITCATHGGCWGLGWGAWQAPLLMSPLCPTVLQDLLLLLDNPSTERVLRPELARELSERPEAFLHQAEEHTRRYAEPRPDTPGP